MILETSRFHLHSTNSVSLHDLDRLQPLEQKVSDHHGCPMVKPREELHRHAVHFPNTLDSRGRLGKDSAPHAKVLPVFVPTPDALYLERSSILYEALSY